MGPGTRYFPYQWVQLQTFEFFCNAICILGLAEIKTLHPRDKIMSKRCRMRGKEKITGAVQILAIVWAISPVCNYVMKLYRWLQYEETMCLK